MAKKKNSEEPEQVPVEAPEGNKTSKDIYTQQKERFFADERVYNLSDEQKQNVLGKFFDSYGVAYVGESGVTDENQIARFRDRFVTENMSKLAEPPKKKEKAYETPDWMDSDFSTDDFAAKQDETEIIPPQTAARDEAARRAMGFATRTPANFKAPVPTADLEITEAVAKDPKLITPQGPNDSSVLSIVRQNVEKIYSEKGWPSPMGKIQQFYEKSAELQRDVQSGKMDEETYTQRIDEMAGEIGIGRKVNGDLYIFNNELELYKEELEKAYRNHLDETGAKEKDGFLKDFFQQLSIGSEDVLNTGTRIMATSEGMSNKLLGLFDSEREGPTYWKDKAELESEIVERHRADNKRYDESITEMLAQGKNGKAALQTVLSAAEALPRLSILAMGNAAGATNVTLGWMGGDKAVQEYMRTENDPNLTEFTRVVNALGKGISEPMFESMGTVRLLNSGRRAIREMGEDAVRKELTRQYQPFLQRQMAIWNKGLGAGFQEAAEEGATALTDDMMDVMSGVKTFDQLGETMLDEMIVGFTLGVGLGSPQMMAEAAGGKSAYAKQVAQSIPEDFDIETKMAMASMIVHYDQLRHQAANASEGVKESYKKEMDHTQDLINDMMDRATFEPTKVAPDLQTFVEKIRDGKITEVVSEETKPAKEEPTEPKAEEKPAEPVKPKEKPEIKPKELTDDQKSHNRIISAVKQYNQTPATHTKKREEIMARVNKDVGALGYTADMQKGKLIAKTDKGKRLYTVSEPGKHTSIEESQDEGFKKFAGEFLEDKNMITDLGVPVYGKKLQKAREDALAGKKNQNSDMLIRGLQEMYEEGSIELRDPVTKEVHRIPVEEIETLMQEDALTRFVEEHGALDATNIDQALEAGLIKEEDYDTTKQQLEAETELRVEEEAELGIDEEIDSDEAAEGKAEVPGKVEYDEKKPWTFDSQFMDKVQLSERIDVAARTIQTLDKMAEEGLTGTVKDSDINLTNDNTAQLFGPGNNKVESAEDITRLKGLAQEAVVESRKALQDLQTLPAKAEGAIRYGGRDFASEEELAEELAKYPTERLPLPDMDIQVAKAIEKAGELRKETKVTEKKEGLSEDMRNLAQNIRKGKIELEGAAMGTLPGFPQAWNFSIEAVATAIETGADIVDAINTGITKLKEQDFFKSLSKEDQDKMESDVRARMREQAGLEPEVMETEAAELSIEDENIIEPKKTTKPKEPEIESEIPKASQKIADRIKKRRQEMRRINAKKQSQAGKVLDEHFVDVNEPFKRAIKREGGEEAQKFINRMNLEAGAPARAKALVQEAQQKIFGKGLRTMSKNQQELLSEIVDLYRTIELDALYKKRGQELLKHEGGINAEDAKAFLEDFRNKEPWILEAFDLKNYDPKKIEKAVKEYHKVMRSQLDRLYENGIISENAYNRLKDEQPYYSPRKYISFMNDIDPDGKLSGIRALQGGSVGEKVVDLNTLLSDAISRTERVIGYNKKMKSAAAYAADMESDIVKNAPFTKAFKEKIALREEMEAQGELFEGMGAELPYFDSEFQETPQGMTDVDYYDNGNRKRVWIDSDLYQYFDYAPADERTEMALHSLSMILGTPILKFFATGANPEFAIKNIPIDALHAWMTTDEYSRFMPAAMAQLVADYSKVAKDAWTKTGKWKDYINEGGGMDFLTTQGTDIMNRYKKYNKKTSTLGQVRDGMAKIGEFSESLTRLALRERYINNRLAKAEKEGKTLSEAEMKSLQEDATAAARNYLDFSQGGKTAKLLDKFIPYFNAGVQVTRGSLRAAGNNPKLFSAKLSQIVGLALTLTAWNMGDIGDEEEAEERRKAYLNDVNEEVKARNFIIMTNMKYTDSADRERRLYFKLPKDALQSNITSLTEDIWIKAVHDGEYKLMDDKMFAAMNNEFRNITDLGNMPPLMRAAQGYKQNYDSFYEEQIWTGREQPEGKLAREFYSGTTHPRFIKFGELTEMSPVRSQYFAKQFFTEGNLYGAMLGEFFDGLAIGFKGEAEEVIQKEGYEKLKNTPGIRRVLKSTFPKEPEAAAEAEVELNRIKTINDQRFNDLVGKKKIQDVDDDSIQDFLMETWEKDGRYEVDRMRDRFDTRMDEDGVGSAVKQLKWFSPQARAVGFYQMLKESPGAEKELWEQAEKANIDTKRFRAEVGRLMTMEERQQSPKK